MSRPGGDTSSSSAHKSKGTKGAHPDSAGFVADPEKFRLLRKLDRRDETIIALRRQLSAGDAYIARLEGMLGIVHRGDSDGKIDPKPLGESTPSSKILKKEILKIAATRVKDGALQAKFDIFLEHPNKLWHWIGDPNIPAENNWAERCIRNTVIFRKTGFGSQGEAAMADREILQSVMETLHLRHEDPVGVLAEALKAYKPKFTRGMSATERQKAKDVAAERVADILFPRGGHMKPKRE